MGGVEPAREFPGAVKSRGLCVQVQRARTRLRADPGRAGCDARGQWVGYKVVPAPVELSTRAWGAYSLSTAAVFASYLQLREHRTIFLFGSYWWFSFVCFLFHRWIQGFVLE